MNTKTILLFGLAGLALYAWWCNQAASSPHAAGRNKGTTVPGYWADVL